MREANCAHFIMGKEDTHETKPPLWGCRQGPALRVFRRASLACATPLPPPLLLHTFCLGKYQPLITARRHITQPLGQSLRWEIVGVGIPVGFQAMLHTMRDERGTDGGGQAQASAGGCGVDLNLN